jgi:hypothetical protein
MEDPDRLFPSYILVIYDILVSSPKPNAASSMHHHAEIGSSLHSKLNIFVGMKK